ncbi:PAS domain-containing hybrid sensor histidine kinase/response regulator [Chitinophaga arvensicola]|uniref:Sensory/regulatory protein RpfC n=1 Tax=Chitinophaga arvensicola TaxID=29529 RepID=A0A1I0SAU4_9BACT|nr:PAS domain-containing hybrid sensor histidine kinase/response regulator [Chitinophaga arvensicola]SEW53703.1 PAS domain S-box-containing protein [Chitinophaga arvensicola]
MKATGKNSKKITATDSTGMPLNGAPDIFSLPITAWLNNTSAGLLVTNEKHRCIWVNDIFSQYMNHHTPLHYSYTELIRYFKPMVEPNFPLEAKMKALRKEKKPWFGWEVPFINGQTWEINYLPIFNGETFSGAIWQAIDITRRHHVQEEIKRNEEKFRVILNNLNAAMCETDVNGNITRVYESFCRLSGYNEEELIGKNITDIFVPENNRAFARALRRKRLDENVPLVYDMEIKLKDGSNRWILASSANIYDRHGNITGGAGIHMDITHQKKLQQDLELARRQAEEAQRAQKDFLASMSHEIRTPLNAIVGMAHLLEETRLDPQQQEYVDILKNSSAILLGIVSDILDISRIEAREVQVNQREFNLRELIQSLRNTFEHKLGRRPVKITAELDPSLNTWLIGDDVLLNQILINLLGNAEKFTNDGEIAITATQESWQDNKLWIRFLVCDTGIGIKKDKLELIFKNYKQAEGDIREKYGGTGLGLAIVKQLVEIQGGNITVEERTGFNTCFSFNIPFLDSRRPLTTQAGKLSRKLLQRSFEDARVLVVEDNPMNLRYIMSLLEKYKINYQLATNGPDATWFLEARQYDLILMDIRIPGMNGLELAQKIRADEDQPNVATPVIATTAVAMESTATMARAAGITDILTKPYTPDQLLQIFNKYLNEDETELIMEEVQNLSGFEFNNDLDVKYLTDLYESNISYAADLFEIFIRTIRDEIVKLQGMVDNQKWEDMKFQVHKLKPNFAMVGLTWISAKMQELENYLRINQETYATDITRLFNEIKEDVNKFYPLVEEEYGKMRDFIDTPSE